jgi:hypothetical protein
VCYVYKTAIAARSSRGQGMVSTERKSLIILTAILATEAVPLAIILAGSPAGAAGRLWGLDSATAAAWLAAAAVTVAYVLYAVRSLPLIGRRFLELSPLKLVAIPMAIVTGAFEELFFRKLLMDWALHHGAGAVAQIALSALVFGLGHGVWGLFGRQWRVAVGATLATAVLGGLLGVVYLIGGRQLAPCVWSHTLINLALEPWLIVAAVSAAQAGWTNRRSSI